MSLIKILKIPSKLFRKEVITFLVIRRYDFGVFDDKLRYISVKPAASISRLRQKIWHLLDLPDYCEEIIVLKNGDGRELPLNHLRQGNDPQHPYYLEVYLPGKQKHPPTILNNMIAMDSISNKEGSISITNDAFVEKMYREINGKNINNEHTTYSTIANNNVFQNTINLKQHPNDYIKSDLSSKVSASSIFFKIHGRKSRDNFANILLKIQSDLMTLNNKLSDLENRIQV